MAPGPTVQHFAGIDTHKDAHVAAVIDHLGRLLSTREFRTTAKGYVELIAWLDDHGPVVLVGVEGTGSYGAGITALLVQRGVGVVEVNRPDRQLRRRHGKTDTVDAEAAARAALNGSATGVAKGRDGVVEAIRLHRLALTGMRKNRTALINTLRAVLVTAPPVLRDELEPLTAAALLTRCARLRTGSTLASDPILAAKQTLKTLARHVAFLDVELARLRAGLTQLTETANPGLLAAPGIGVDSAAALLVAAGDNPGRMRNESAFASLCGVSPIEASSGRTVRHRLNRGGDRQANSALWRIAMIRLNNDPKTKAYAARRRGEGKTQREITRCLKRHIAREVYRLLTHPQPITGVFDLRPSRQQLGLSMQSAADQLGVSLTTISRTERGIKPNHALADTYRQWLKTQVAHAA